MRRAIGTISMALLTVATVAPVWGAAIPVDDFTVIAGAEFFDIPQTFDTSATIGSIGITGTPPTVLGKIQVGASGSASDPGSGDGWSNPQVIPVVLDLSVPTSAFGVSFIQAGLFGGNLPARLDVFDQPGGVGNLVGTITSSGLPPGPLIDFVGIWSDETNIRSAVVPYLDHATSVDGYVVSTTPLPEPGSLLARTSTAAVGSPFRGRRKSMPLNRQLLEKS